MSEYHICSKVEIGASLILKKVCCKREQCTIIAMNVGIVKVAEARLLQCCFSGVWSSSYSGEYIALYGTVSWEDFTPSTNVLFLHSI